MSGRKSLLFQVLAMLFATQAVTAADGPVVRVTAQWSPGPSITVEASDRQGLDTLDIACIEADTNYHTQLPRSGGSKFQRTFALRELFPDVREWKSAVQIQVKVR